MPAPAAITAMLRPIRLTAPVPGTGVGSGASVGGTGVGSGASVGDTGVGSGASVGGTIQRAGRVLLI